MAARADLATSGGATAGSVAALTIPRQHGAWSVLLLGYALGVGALGALNGATALFLALMVAGFLARHTIATWLRLPQGDGRRRTLAAWAVGYVVVAASALSALVLVYDRWLTLPLGALLLLFAAVSAVLEWRRKNRTAWGEWVNILGLSVVAPAAAYVGSGAVNWGTLGLWALAAVFFTASVFHVRYLVRRRSSAGGPLAERLRAGASSLMYHGLGLGLIVGLAVAGIVPFGAALAMAPTIVKAVWVVRHRQSGPLSIRRLGYSELAHSLAFVLLAVAAYRVGPGA